MNRQEFGTIAALDFCVPPRQAFEDIVEELDIMFRPEGLTRRSMIWDGNDLAMIERDAVRLLLAWVSTGRADGSSYLVIGVGQSPEADGTAINAESCRFVKTALLAHLESYLSFHEVVHVDVACPLDSAVLDRFAEILCDLPVCAGQHHSQAPDATIRFDTLDTLDGTEPIEACSLPKRLTIYALGATIFLYTPPIGATLLAYTTLRDFVPERLQNRQLLAA